MPRFSHCLLAKGEGDELNTGRLFPRSQTRPMAALIQLHRDGEDRGAGGIVPPCVYTLATLSSTGVFDPEPT